MVTKALIKNPPVREKMGAISYVQRCYDLARKFQVVKVLRTRQPYNTNKNAK